MSAEDIEYMDGYKEFPTKESALEWLDFYLSLDERNNLIRALQQEPKTGHWIEGNYHIRCSECGEDYTYRLRNYCPNCGAKMQEVEE